MTDVLHTSGVRVIEGGRGVAPARRVQDEVSSALAVRDSGGAPAPLFLVAPGTDLQAAAAEATSLGIPNDAGVLMRTSGSTTGTGKIVAISWDALIASANATADRFGGHGAWLADLPVHHIAGFQTVARSVLAGVDPLAFDATDAASARVAVRRAGTENIYFSLVPTQLARIVDSPDLTDALSPTTFLVGSQSISPELLERARAAGLTVATSYGMTETCGGCVYDGVPIGNAQIHLDESGRVSIQGDMVALGYLGGIEPESWRETTPRTHVTRDAGRITDGRLEILGRVDDAITTGGLTVIPTLIEREISALTGCANVVVPTPHPTWGEAVTAVVDGDVDTDAVRTHVKAKLGPGWAPNVVIPLTKLGGSWPLKDSGKVDRKALSARARVYLHG